jgi:MscS family membrane protein
VILGLGAAEPFAWLLDALRWPAGWSRAWAAAVLTAILILVGAWLASRFLSLAITRAVRQIASRTRTTLDDQIIDIAERPFRRMIVVAGFYYAVGVLPLGLRGRRFATGVIFAIAIWVGAKLITKVLMVLVGAYGGRMQDPTGKVQFEKDYMPLIGKVIGVVIAVIGLIAVLDHFGQNVSSLVAALGVGGAAIGLAAKDSLGHMMAGFTILADRPFRPGDRIKLATGEVGDVLEVGTRATRVRLLDHNMLIVPNAELVHQRVINFNYPSHASRADLKVGIAYGSDIEAAKAIVMGVIQEQPEVMRDPAPTVLLAQFGDSALEIQADYLVSEFVSASVVQDRVRTEVYRRFQAKGIQIPYPTMEIIQSGGARLAPG